MTVGTSPRPGDAMAAARRVLSEVFGFAAFRPGQERVIEALLAGGNALAVMPTVLPGPGRKGRNGAFHDKGLEGASHHAIVPNVNTIGELKEVWPRLSPDEKKLFDAVARSYLAADREARRCRTTATGRRR